MSLLLALDEWPGLFHVPFFPPAAGEWKRRRGPLALRSGATAPDNPACFREVNSPADSRASQQLSFHAEQLANEPDDEEEEAVSVLGDFGEAPADRRCCNRAE